MDLFTHQEYFDAELRLLRKLLHKYERNRLECRKMFLKTENIKYRNQANYYTIAEAAIADAINAIQNGTVSDKVVTNHIQKFNQMNLF